MKQKHPKDYDEREKTIMAEYAELYDLFEISCHNPKNEDEVQKATVEVETKELKFKMMDVGNVLLKYHGKKLDGETHNSILKDLGFTLFQFPIY